MQDVLKLFFKRVGPVIGGLVSPGNSSAGRVSSYTARHIARHWSY